jgi:hypothetical protein
MHVPYFMTVPKHNKEKMMQKEFNVVYVFPIVITWSIIQILKSFSGKSFAERNFCLKIYSRAEYNPNTFSTTLARR